jgi:hypothetical protein
MAVLAVSCKGCGALVRTGIRTGWVSRPVLGSKELPCPGCGTQALYHGEDFRAAA